MSDSSPDARIVEIDDENSTLAARALDLIQTTFDPRERQPVEQITMEIAEKRLGLLTSYDFHLFAAVDDADHVLGVSSGVYLGGVNVGLVTYLAVAPGARELGIGRRVRSELVEAFRRDARLIDWPDLYAVVGEVRIDNPWLRRLVRERKAVPLAFRYYHPGQDLASAVVEWVLYRQPIGDEREALPTTEVRQLLYAIWRRAYRVRWPLKREGFIEMLRELEGRTEIGSHPAIPGNEA